MTKKEVIHCSEGYFPVVKMYVDDWGFARAIAPDGSLQVSTTYYGSYWQAVQLAATSPGTFPLLNREKQELEEWTRTPRPTRYLSV